MPPVIVDRTLFAVADVQIRLVDVVVIVVSILVMMTLQYVVFGTRLGRAMRAVAYDARTASLMGINVDRIISFTFVLGSMLAAFAGVLFALKYPGLNQPAHTTWVLLGLKAFVAAVVGGIGNIRGAVAGGLLIGAVELFGAAYLSPHLRDVYVFALLILVLLAKPQGPARPRHRREGVMQRFAPLIVIAVAVLMHFVVVPLVGGFYGKILLDIGINVLLAVSLNIVNGFTGQFSIGHAGFMAVGGYTAAVITFYGGLPAIWFPFACIVGGLVAALFGFVVGLPSLRLRGDYLAIVTLGFGEIVRVTLQRTDAVGGALGFVGLAVSTRRLCGCTCFAASLCSSPGASSTRPLAALSSRYARTRLPPKRWA